jgi:SAM-dependent methyltransferase
VEARAAAEALGSDVEPVERRAYEAPDLLEVMEEAVRYNRFLVRLLVAWSEGTRRVLDFGAGNGHFVRALRAAGRCVHAVEPDAALRAGIERDGIPAHAGLDALGGQRFDAIYSLNVLEHIPDDRAALAALHERLEPGGRLLLYVPAFPILFSANDRRVGHVRRYRRGPLVAALREAGFEVERSAYVDVLGFPAALLYRAFGDPEGGLDPRTVRLYDTLVFPLSRVLDRALDRVLGKNLLVVASRSRGRSLRS